MGEAAKCGLFPALLLRLRMPLHAEQRLDSTNQLLVEAQMNKFEMATAEEIVVETIDEQAVELSLPELDMVGGGSMCVALC